MLDRRVSSAILRHGYRYPFSQCAALLRDSDITFANLESPISSRGTANRNKRIVFEAPPEAIKSLRYSGINIVSLANNHSLDYGAEALGDTLGFLGKTGIRNVGLEYSQDRWNGIPIKKYDILRRNGVAFGFAAFSSIVPRGFAPSKTRPGIATTKDFAAVIRKRIREMKSEADVAIISLHMGKEYLTGKIIKSQEMYAKEAIDAGADAVIGHHPHVLEKIERYKGGIIFYSLGNFVFDQKESVHRNVSRSAIVKMKFSGKRLESYSVIPAVIRNRQPVPLNWEMEHVFYSK